MTGGTDYDLFCKAVAKRVFKNKTRADLALDITRLVEFGKTLPEDQGMEVENKIKLLEKLFTQEKWFAGAGDADKHSDNPDFGLSHVWREYKECLQSAPKKPLCGGSSWDITRWPEKTKAEFVLEGPGGQI